MWKQDFKNCRQIKQWLETKTKQPIVHIYKTDVYLYIIWGHTAKINKIKLPGQVIYCLKEDNFNDILKEMNDSYKFLQLGE